jgi:hypothetical protein
MDRRTREKSVMVKMDDNDPKPDKSLSLAEWISITVMMTVIYVGRHGWPF